MKFFKFIIRYFGFLKAIPLMPHIFDVLMRLHSFCFRREITDAMDKIQEELNKDTNITISIHKYGGIQFNYKNKELGHIHGNGMVDVLLNKKMKSELIAKKWVQEHHTFKDSGWVTLFLKSDNDIEIAVKVLKMSLSKSKAMDSIVTKPNV